jgi:hypothetical protein
MRHEKPGPPLWHSLRGGLPSSAPGDMAGASRKVLVPVPSPACRTESQDVPDRRRPCQRREHDAPAPPSCQFAHRRRPCLPRHPNDEVLLPVPVCQSLIWLKGVPIPLPTQEPLSGNKTASDPMPGWSRHAWPRGRESPRLRFYALRTKSTSPISGLAPRF